MSLRCVGNQLLQTAPSPLLAGASTASLSFWVRINPGHQVSNPDGVEIFGDEGGKFSATLAGSDGLRLRWSSTSGGSSCALTLVPGASHHLAATWRDGSQAYYLDGEQVGADTQAGPIGVPGDAASRPYRLGSDSAGVDATLGDPTLWVGHALSPQEVLGLRDRAAQPSAIAPSAIALRWSLAGPDAVEARVGDAGLADASPTGLDLSTVVGAAPTYQAADLAHVASPAIGHAAAEGPGPAVAASPSIGHAMIAGSGQSIVVKAVDGSGNPATMTAVATGNEVQDISVGGTTLSGSFTLGFGGQTTGSIAFTAVSPGKYGTYTITGLTAGHAYRISLNWPLDPYSSNSLLAELIDSNGLIYSATPFNETVAPASFSDGTFPTTATAYWQDISASAGFAPSGTSFSVRITAAVDGRGPFFTMPALRVLDVTGGGAAAFYEANSPTFSHAASGDFVLQGGNPSYYNGIRSGFLNAGSGLGGTFAVDPVASGSAILALSSIQPQGAQVTATSSGIAVEFIGPMGATAQPLFASSNPLATVSRAAVGGNVPMLSIDGGAAIPLTSPWIFQWITFNRPSSWAMATLPQASPRQTINCRMGDSFFGAGKVFGASQAGGWAYSHADAAADGLYSLVTRAAGDSITFSFEGVRPGLYDFAVNYVPSSDLSTAAVFTIQDQYGNLLQTATIDQTATPGDFTSNGYHYKTIGTGFAAGYSNNKFVVSLASTGNKIAIGAVQMVPHPSNAPSLIVPPGSTASLAIPDGFFTCAGGPIAAATIAVDNRSGGTILPPYDMSKAKMEVAFNMSDVGYPDGIIDFSNLVRRTNALGLAGHSLDNSDGYPTKILDTYPYLNYLVTEPDVLTKGNGRGFKNCPAGVYALHWHGASDMLLYDGGGGSVAEIANSLTGLEKVRVYQVTPSPAAYSPTLLFRVYPTGLDPSDPSGNTKLADVSNIRLYPPDPSDPTGQTQWLEPVPKFHPSYINFLRGIRGIRWMNITQVNDGPFRDFADIIPDTYIGRSDIAHRVIQVPVVQFEGITTQEDMTDYVVIKVTTAVPHGCYDGAYITAIKNNGTGVFSANFQAGTNQRILSTFFNVIAKVISPTEIHLHCPGDWDNAHKPAAPVQMTNILTGGSITFDKGSSWSMDDVKDLQNALPELKSCWYNTPFTASTDCVTSIATFLAQNLAPGVKWRHEVGNEVWNTGFPQTWYARLRTFQITGGIPGYNIPGYMTDADAQHRAARAAWVAAGRDPNDYIATWGCFGGSGRAASQALYASGGGVAGWPGTAYVAGQPLPMQYDEVAIAPYLGNAAVADDRQNDAMTPDQFLDLLELYVQEPGYPYTTQVLADTTALFPNAKVVIYETSTDGEPIYGIAPFHGGGSTVAGNAAYKGDGGYPANVLTRMRAMHHSPRIYGIVKAFLAYLDAEGVTLLNWFTGAGSSYFPYPAFEWYDQKRGTGNALADGIDGTNYDAMDTIPSEVGGALHDWNAALGSSGTTTKPNEYDKGKNGKLTTHGYKV